MLGAYRIPSFFLIIILPFSFMKIEASCLKPSLLQWLPNGRFSNLINSSIYISRNFTLRKCVSFSVYLFMTHCDSLNWVIIHLIIYFVAQLVWVLGTGIRAHHSLSHFLIFCQNWMFYMGSARPFPAPALKSATSPRGPFVTEWHVQLLFGERMYPSLHSAMAFSW